MPKGFFSNAPSPFNRERKSSQHIFYYNCLFICISQHIQLEIDLKAKTRHFLQEFIIKYLCKPDIVKIS